jgi:glycosyltransferase involved in cell wall biosynthesis
MPVSPADFRLHPLHRLWRLLPVQERRWLVTRVAGLLAPRPDRHPPPPPPVGGIAVAGELSYPSGLGEGARLILLALEQLGIRGFPIDTGTVVSDGGRRAPIELPPAVPLLVHVNSPQMALALLRLPRGLVRGRRIIGHWAWELPTVPPDWRIGTRFVHEIWAPSRFTADALESLMPGRVRVVPYPLAAAPPVPSTLDRASFGLPADAVIVLVSFNLASSLERKNPLGAIAAFRAAFGERSDRLLVMKVGNPQHFPDDFARIREAVGDAANIRIETRTLPRADGFALTAAADIVLSLHRSEGFGLVPAEAMLLGRPVVATGWSGNVDFMDADSAVLVGCRLIPAVDPRGVFEAPGAVWADPDIGEAAAALRRLADDPAERAALGARARAMAMARLGPGALTSALAGIGLKLPA